MKIIIAGRVKAKDFAMADLYGIAPTEFHTNGLSQPPAEMGLPCEVFPLEPKLGDPDMARRQRNMTMVLHADGLVIEHDFDPHLLECAVRLKLPVMEV